MFRSARASPARRSGLGERFSRGVEDLPRHDPGARKRLDPELGIGGIGGNRCSESTMAGTESVGECVYFEVEVIIRRTAGIADTGDHGTRSDPLSDFTASDGVVVVDREDAQLPVCASHRGVMPNGDGERTRFNRSGVDHLAGADRMYRCPVGIVEFDALMLLEVPSIVEPYRYVWSI